MSGRNDLWNIGSYRKNKEPMQIISGPIGDPKVHFEAPPPERLLSKMKKYILWFNQNAKSLPLLHASIGHLYFESIHPFEDGNGRIGRILVIKSLSQSANQPLLIALSEIIQQKKKQYYESLQLCNNTLDITEWILYFVQTILKAQDYSIKLIELIIYKSKVMKYFKKKLINVRKKQYYAFFMKDQKDFQEV
jgi:Fic family protein